MRIMIADSHPEVRAALRLLLEEQAATWIVASEAGNAIELVNRVRSANPRVILIDWDLPGMRVTQAGAGSQRADKIFVALKAISPQTNILVLSTNPEARDEAMRAGGDAFLSKSEPPQRLMEAIQSLSVGIAEERAQPSWKPLPNLPVEPIK